MVDRKPRPLFLIGLGVWLSFIATTASICQTLPEEILFEKIPIPGTIRSSQVSDITQDRLGLIWLAGDCLYRYDGFAFKQYRDIANSKFKLNPTDVHCLFYDSISNRLLLGTHKYGIVAYDYKTDNLTILPSSSTPPVIHSIAQTNDGRIWVASHGSGLYFLDGDTLKTASSFNALPLYPLSFMALGSKIFVGESASVYVLEKNTIVEQIKLPEDIPLYTRITALHFDSSGNLWMGTENRGVFVYKMSTRTFVNHFGPTQAPFFSRISEILEDNDGLIWILTKASGIAVYSPGENRLLGLTRNPFDKPSLSSDNCFSILKDNQGIIWIGATGDLNKYDRDQIRFKHIYHNPQRKISITDNMVRGLHEDRDGIIWVGTDGGYINLLDMANQTSRAIKVSLARYPGNYVPFYFLELNDRVSLVASSMGLLEFDRKKEKFSPYDPVWSVTKGKSVRQLVRHNDQLYFIAQGRLFIHDLRTFRTENYSTFGDPTATNATAIHLDDQNRLWIGLNRGVAMLNPDKTFRYFPFTQLPLPTRTLLLVLSIQQVGNKLYVATFNAGLWELDITDVRNVPEPTRFLEADGLPSNTIYSIVPDNKGFLWLSTNGGLVKFDRAKKQFLTFSITEGLQEEEFNRLAYLKRGNGELVFGGINGVNIFNPDKIQVATEDFNPKILSITADNPFVSRPTTSTFNPTAASDLVLSYDQNFIRIHFFVPVYQVPKRYKLSYRLENFEKEWNETLYENVASYSNLPDGDYKFMVRASDINGRENVTSLAFTITPPFWKTWWFVLLAIWTTVFLVISIIRSYIRKARYDRQKLEELLKIRTFEIEKSKEELHILNQKKDLIFSILSHDLRSPLTTLKGFLGYLIAHAHELTTEELKRHAVNIKNSVTNSLDLIDNTLFWSLSQMGNIHYTPTSFVLRNLLEKLRGLYQLTADKKRIPLSISCDTDIVLYGDENMIYVTLRNLVSNALKFTAEGNPVMISCMRKEGYVEINVVDSGIGMSEEYLRRVLSTDQPMLKKGTSNEKGTGLGLLLCKKFVEINKGELRISSTEHVGTTFTVLLPLAVEQPAVVEG